MKCGAIVAANNVNDNNINEKHQLLHLVPVTVSTTTIFNSHELGNYNNEL